jgi:hypothetical protein
MPEKYLHIVSFDVPWPPNYGGVIDVYYKLVALKKEGIKIHLHCFQYGREKSEILENLCESVHYYDRKTGILSELSVKPYIVQSRRSELLMANLLKDDHPILFEGLHTCNYLDSPRLKSRKKIFRESNIEHHYYFHLFKAEKSIFKKFFHLTESLRLKFYQKRLKHADLMLTISQTDTEYLKKHFPNNNIEYLPSFHPNEKFSVLPGKGEYALYHGKLSVTENLKAAEFLIKKVFAGLDRKLIIAGLEPPPRLRSLIDKYENVDLAENPDDEKMFDMIRNAHVNVLITFQATGLKLKLLNTLYNGRFCLVNPDMVQGTGLGPLCEIAENAAGLRKKVEGLFARPFEMSKIRDREKLLKENYSNRKNAEKLVRWVF